jgi:hypothetical protein
MNDWRKFWNEFPTTIGELDFLAQVGHTISGKPYDAAQFAAMISSIKSALALGADSSLLDVCCGNGVITRELAVACRNIVAVDFSEALVGIACRYNGAPNLTYRVMNALELETAHLDDSFDRFSMYAALQHFQSDDLDKLLRGVMAHATSSFLFLVGGILDLRRKSAFLDTPEKRSAYEAYRKEGKDRLGTWWDPQYIVDRCRVAGLKCLIDDYSPGRPGAHFRFDAHISR